MRVAGQRLYNELNHAHVVYSQLCCTDLHTLNFQQHHVILQQPFPGELQILKFLFSYFKCSNLVIM
jgi:hypothetical protein